MNKEQKQVWNALKQKPQIDTQEFTIAKQKISNWFNKVIREKK